MESERNQEDTYLKSCFLERLTEVFSNQMSSIVLAVELLKSSNYLWSDAESIYLDLVERSARKMMKIMEDKAIFIERNKDGLHSTNEQSSLAWWLKINTMNPSMTYYFGPFISAQEAEIAQPSYINNLEQDGLQIQTIQIQQRQPASIMSENQFSQKYKIQVEQSFNPNLN